MILTGHHLLEFLACLPLFILYRYVSRRRQYPPGPDGYPLVGHAFHLPKKKLWETFQRWGKDYGEYSLFNLSTLTNYMSRPFLLYKYFG